MTPRRRVVAAIGCTLFTVGCQEPPAFTAADEAFVRSLFDSTQVWFKARRFDEWSQEFATDGFMQPPNGKTLTGRAQLIAWASSFPPIESIVFSNVRVAGDGNMAMGTSDFALKLKDMPADTGKQIVVTRRSADGKWEIIGLAFNSDLPVAPPPAPSAPATPASK